MKTNVANIHNRPNDNFRYRDRYALFGMNRQRDSSVKAKNAKSSYEGVSSSWLVNNSGKMELELLKMILK